MSSSAPTGVDGIDGDARQYARILDELNRPVEVGKHLDMNRDAGGAGLHERRDVRIRILNHQVDVERDRGDPVDGAHDQRAKRDVWHEMAIHDVEVQQIGAAALDGRDLGSQRA